MRTIPKVNIEVPPLPTTGSIGRVFFPSAISDYEGIATATWSSGATGTITNKGTSNGSWNCLYHHFTIANPAVDGYDVIMSPLRYEADCPASNGGVYDHLYAEPVTNLAYKTNVIATGNTSTFGTVAIDKRLLRAPSHGIFTGGKAYITTRFGVSGCRARQDDIFKWMETALQAIASTTPPLTQAATVFATIHAIRHRVNGSAVGSLVVQPFSPYTDTRMRIDLATDDEYACDVWYRIRYLPSLIQGTAAKKSCFYIPTTKVSNGSKRFRSAGIENTSGPGGIVFGNIDWTPDFNRLEQSYNVTASGHSAWNLEGGSDGPLPMVVNSRGYGEATAPGLCELYPSDPSNPNWRGIWIVFGVECPFAIMFMGPSSGAANKMALYMPATVGNYRTSVYVTDEANTFNVYSAGPFDEAGTTTFNLIPWSLKRPSQGIFTESSIRSNYGAGGLLSGHPEAHRGLAAIPSDVPTSLTFTRINV